MLRSIAWLGKNSAIIASSVDEKFYGNIFPGGPLFLWHLIYNQYNHVYGWIYCIFVLNVGCNFNLQLMQSTPK